MLDVLITIGIIIGSVWLILFAVEIIMLIVAFIQDKSLDYKINKLSKIKRINKALSKGCFFHAKKRRTNDYRENSRND